MGLGLCGADCDWAGDDPDFSPSPIPPPELSPSPSPPSLSPSLMPVSGAVVILSTTGCCSGAGSGAFSVVFPFLPLSPPTSPTIPLSVFVVEGTGREAEEDTGEGGDACGEWV